MKLAIYPPVEPERLDRITAAAGPMAVVKRLGGVLLCKRPDLRFGHSARSAHEPLTDPQVFEEEGWLVTARVGVCHKRRLLTASCASVSALTFASSVATRSA